MALKDIIPIHLEFSPRLGVRELPEFGKDYQTNVKGMYVAGDIADAPIIKVALNQGHGVAENIIKKLKSEKNEEEYGLLDLLIVGAGPAGIGAALAAKDAGLKYNVLEKEKPFNTIQNYPRHKKIFSEPRKISLRPDLWFKDAAKEDLIDRWEKEIDAHSLEIQQPVEVTNIKKEGKIFYVSVQDENKKTWEVRTRKVLLAIGRRGTVQKPGIPGEDREHVWYALHDPRKFDGRTVLVMGGGDSAVEAACSLADNGAKVHIVYRQDWFHRAKAGNQDRIRELMKQGLVTPHFNCSPLEIKEKSVKLGLGGGGKDVSEVPADDVFVFFGTLLPKNFLSRIGLRMSGDMTVKRALWVSGFAGLTYLFYLLKAYRFYWPFGKEDIWGTVPGSLVVDLGFRAAKAGPGFWGTVIYSVFILYFGLFALRKYRRDPIQVRRFISLILFQLFFLFGIPELIAPLFIGGNAGKLYALTVPWPLNTYAFFHPGQVYWAIGAALVSFVAIPIYVRFNGTRFCSYMCGCGGLAETFGDFWRHLAPRGRTAAQAEKFGRLILILAIPLTLLIINDAWQLFQPKALASSTVFAKKWYGLMVDFWFASIVGVAAYPYLGSRIWCRFICPLRAYMQLLANLFSRIKITPNDNCIGCGECTRYCQMGIDVQKFSQMRTDFSNANSECIQCGICLTVCPMNVLSFTRESKAKAVGLEFK